MLRLRTAFTRVYRHLSPSRRGQSKAVQPVTARMVEVGQALHRRQQSGLQTSLRQLHTICELSQAEALNIAAQLEDMGAIVIERDLNDAFESQITLSEDAGARFDSKLDRPAVQPAG